MDHYKTRVTVWIPIHVPIFGIGLQYKPYIEAVGRLIRRLPEALKIVTEARQITNVSLKSTEIILDTPSDSFLANLKAFNLVPLSPYLTYEISMDYLKIECDVTLDANSNFVQEADPRWGTSEQVMESLARLYVSEACRTILILLELAEPAQINTYKGLVATQQYTERIESEYSFHKLYKTPVNDDSLWPSLKSIDLLNVVHWASKTSLLSSALAYSKVERALAAYTQVMRLSKSSSMEGEILFRAMQGLEAFYCDGGGSLTQQLSQKVSLWLGKWQNKKKLISKLYSLRSEFVHGSEHLEYYESHFDAWQEDEKRTKEFSEAVMLAVRLLVATLQKCIIDNVLDVDWSYSFKMTTLED